MYQNCHGP
uniref:Uncharacterized protein n=1 Tax=Anguilla anguilla TaxID=7936 RepID=A0A0E9XS90_ANGAN